MPYKSKKQAAYFHANEDKIGKKTVEEFDRATAREGFDKKKKKKRKRG